jgi:hypothetical protein
VGLAGGEVDADYAAIAAALRLAVAGIEQPRQNSAGGVDRRIAAINALLTLPREQPVFRGLVNARSRLMEPWLNARRANPAPAGALSVEEMLDHA